MLENIQQTHTSTGLKIFGVLIFFVISFLAVGGFFALNSYILSRNAATLNGNFTINPINFTQPTANTSSTSTTVTWTTKSVQTKFDLPGILHPSYSVAVYCVINTSSFIQNNPSTINVSLSFPTTCWHDLNIGYVEVQPVDAVDSFPNWNPPNTYEPIDFSDFFLYQVDSVGASQNWNGSDGIGFPVLFEDSGLIQLRLNIFATPQSSDFQYLNNTGLNDPISTRLLNFNDNFNTTIAVPIYIESSQDAQLQQAQQTWQQSMLNNGQLLQAIENQTFINQQEWENQTLTDNLKWQTQQQSNGDFNIFLTCLVIALMLLDMAVIVFDHSVDKDKEAEYKNKQRQSSQKSKLKYPEYAV